MRIGIFALALFLSAAFAIPATVHAGLQCTVCQEPTCPAAEKKVNIFNISDSYNAHVGPANKQVICNDGENLLYSTGDRKYNASVIRVSSLQNGHAQRADTYSNYPFVINLSSDQVLVLCDYQTGDCGSGSECVVSLSDDTNAHVGECEQYDLKVCCSTKDVVGPECNVTTPEWAKEPFEVSWECTDPSGIASNSYNVDYKIMKDGSLVRDWTSWHANTNPGSDTFSTGLQNNYTYYFRVSATDKDGNTGDYYINKTTYDKDYPQIVSSGSNDEFSHEFTVHSDAWDGVSGIAEHTIDCTTTNPGDSYSKICPVAAPFGEISHCQDLSIGYDEHTEISCEIEATDRAGNENSTNVYFSLAPDHPLVEFSEKSVFISMGDTHYGMVYVRNVKPSADEVNASLEGSYPAGLFRFTESQQFKWISTDGKNITVSLGPYEQKMFYVEITSTDNGDYKIVVNGASKNFPVTDRDEMDITVGFQAAFPGIEALSMVLIIGLSAIAYWRIRK